MKTALIGLLLVSGAIRADEAPKQDSKEPTRETLASLRQERVQTLENLSRYYRDLFSNGIHDMDLEVVVQTHIRLAKARIQAAQSRKEKIKLLENTLKSAIELERLVIDTNTAGLSTEADVLNAKAGRLQIQIMLLEEKQQGPK